MSRIVVFGASGFIGFGIAQQLSSEGNEVIRLTRRDVDLVSVDAPLVIRSLVKDNDLIVFAAADAPCKNVHQFENNIVMLSKLLEGLAEKSLASFCYLSSDAVYCDTRETITESTPTNPSSLHGLMHLTRERLLQHQPNPSLVLRPTLVYGAHDPHNGYGPNRFIRLAKRGDDIELFGNGEELRDHLHISDLVGAAAFLITSGATGNFNIATGEVTSFRDIATISINVSRGKSRVLSTPRHGPLPHMGLRQFDISRLRDVVPHFKPKPLAERLGMEYPFYGS